MRMKKKGDKKVNKKRKCNKTLSQKRKGWGFFDSKTIKKRN
jgi:hypothetical protein